MGVAYDARTALVVVDVQNDFADPAGSLTVPGADEVIAAVNEEIDAASAAGCVRRVHPRLAPAAHAALRHRRRPVAGALRPRHVGRRVPPGPRRRRRVGVQGHRRRGRLLRLHDERSGRPARRPRPGCTTCCRPRHRARRRRRAGARLLRQGDGPRRRRPRLRLRRAPRRHRAGRGQRRRRRRRRGERWPTPASSSSAEPASRDDASRRPAPGRAGSGTAA